MENKDIRIEYDWSLDGTIYINSAHTSLIKGFSSKDDNLRSDGYVGIGRLDESPNFSLASDEFRINFIFNNLKKMELFVLFEYSRYTNYINENLNNKIGQIKKLRDLADMTYRIDKNILTNDTSQAKYVSYTSSREEGVIEKVSEYIGENWDGLTELNLYYDVSDVESFEDYFNILIKPFESLSKVKMEGKISLNVDKVEIGVGCELKNISFDNDTSKGTVLKSKIISDSTSTISNEFSIDNSKLISNAKIIISSETTTNLNKVSINSKGNVTIENSYDIKSSNITSRKSNVNLQKINYIDKCKFDIESEITISNSNNLINLSFKSNSSSLHINGIEQADKFSIKSIGKIKIDNLNDVNDCVLESKKGEVILEEVGTLNKSKINALNHIKIDNTNYIDDSNINSKNSYIEIGRTEEQISSSGINASDFIKILSNSKLVNAKINVDDMIFISDSHVFSNGEQSIDAGNLYLANKTEIINSNYLVKGEMRMDNVKSNQCNFESNSIEASDSNIENNSKIFVNKLNIRGEESRSVFSNLSNSISIEGELTIINSEIDSRNIIFQNVDGETILIKDSTISDDSIISGNVKVESAKVIGNSTLFGNSFVSGDYDNKVKLSGYVKIFEKAQIKDSADISGFVNVYGESEVSGNSKVYGKVNILDDSRVSGNSVLSKEEIINKYEERYE